MWEKQWIASGTAPIRDLAHNQGMCPDWESNCQPSGLEASAQSTEPYQLGKNFIFIFKLQFQVYNPIIRHEYN